MKRTVRGFNEQTYSDCTLEIRNQEGTLMDSVYVSKYVLALPSAFFRQLFQKDPVASVIPVTLGEGQTIEHFKDALRCTYKEDPANRTQKHLIEVMQWCTKAPGHWDLQPTIKQCMKLLSPTLAVWRDELKAFFQLNEDLMDYECVREGVMKVKAALLEKFKSVRDIFYELKNAFLDLPFDAILEILKSDRICVDSENSLFYALCTWINHQKEEQSKKDYYMETALDYIRFPQMRTYFLLDVVPHVATLYQHKKEIRDKLMFYQRLAEECKLVCPSTHDTINWDSLNIIHKTHIVTLLNNRHPQALNSFKASPRNSPTADLHNIDLFPKEVETAKLFLVNADDDMTDQNQQQHQPQPELFSPRSVNAHYLDTFFLRPKTLKPHIIFEKTNSFTIKCEFRNISQLTLKSRYYSAPVVAHGYEFYFFLRQQRINPHLSDEPHNLALAGYLRCTSKILPPKHYLPIQSTVAVQLEPHLNADNTANPPIQQRKFAPSAVIFEAPEKAIGGRLTLIDENWQTIINKKCPIVYADMLTAFVTVEFLDTDNKCRAVEETLVD